MPPFIAASLKLMRFPVVFTGSVLLGYVFALALAWAALQSGLAMKILAPAMARHERFQLQGEFADIRLPAIRSGGVLVIGDRRFMEQAVPRLGGTPKQIVLPAASLNNIAAALRGLPPQRFDRVVIQNGYWYWSDAAADAFGADQNVALAAATQAPSFGIASVRIILDSIKSAVAKASRPRGLPGRPHDMLNVSFENPPHWSAAAVAELARILPARGAASWVYENESLPPLTSDAFRTALDDALRSGSLPTSLGTYVSMDRLTPIGSR